MRLRRSRDEVRTDPAALAVSGGGIEARVTDEALLEPAADLVRWVLKRPGFASGHYGFWPIRVGEDGVIEHADRALRAYVAQEQVCWDVASEFEPPQAEATAVVAPGALDRERLVADRYEYMAPQSGWYLGGREGVRRPLAEIVARRPELLDFLALEPGWTVALERDGARVKRRP